MTHSVCCDLDVLWCWALAGRAGRARSAQAGLWARRRQARAPGRRAGARQGARARGRARGRQAGRADGRQQRAGRAGRAQQGHGLGAGRAAWARELALGSALGPFSIRFDSFFS